MKVLKELLLPLFIVAFNVGLGLYTGLIVFHVMAAVILGLVVVKVWRGRPAP